MLTYLFLLFANFFFVFLYFLVRCNSLVRGFRIFFVSFFTQHSAIFSFVTICYSHDHLCICLCSLHCLKMVWEVIMLFDRRSPIFFSMHNSNSVKLACLVLKPFSLLGTMMFSKNRKLYLYIATLLSSLSELFNLPKDARDATVSVQMC